MERVYNKAESEEVAPGMGGAIGRACALLAVESFVQDLDRVVSLAGECAVGSDRTTCTNARFHRFCIPKEHLAPSVTIPIRGSFVSI